MGGFQVVLAHPFMKSQYLACLVSMKSPHHGPLSCYAMCVPVENLDLLSIWVFHNLFLFHWSYSAWLRINGLGLQIPSSRIGVFRNIVRPFNAFVDQGSLEALGHKGQSQVMQKHGNITLQSIWFQCLKHSLKIVKGFSFIYLHFQLFDSANKASIWQTIYWAKKESNSPFSFLFMLWAVYSLISFSLIDPE